MNIATLQALASDIGLHKLIDVPSEKMLIRAIQQHRGEESCYSSDKRYACKANCEWRASCQKLRAVWLR